jgi:cytochrome c-type biogenesis protein
VTLAVAFLGGLVSCLSPCVLPVLPVFVAHVARPGTLPSGAGLAAVSRRSRAAGFLLGFGGVFVLLWVSLGLVGFALLQTAPDLRPVAGLAIVALGLATILGWQPHLARGRWGSTSSFAGSFLLGAGVAIGWTPCIGPTLGAILTMAAAAETVWAGALLLVAYALGMTLPLLAIALGLTRIRPLMQALARHARPVQVASGTLIVGVGVLVATNAFARLAALVPWGF